MRPISIVNFERCYLGAIAIGLGNSLLTLPTMMRTPQLAQATAMFGSGFFYISAIVSTVVLLLLWYLTARRASVVAKWIIVVFFALGALGMLYNLMTGFASVPSQTGVILRIVAFILQAVAVYLLFKPDAVTWLNGDRADLRETFE